MFRRNMGDIRREDRRCSKPPSGVYVTSLRNTAFALPEDVLCAPGEQHIGEDAGGMDILSRIPVRTQGSRIGEDRGLGASC